MTTAYSTLLGLALPVTGELAGQWGETVNDYITKYLDAAVAGAQTISGSQTAVTLSVTNGSALSQAGSGGTGSAQYAIINCTGNPASLLTITAPAASKVYLLINATSTSQSVKLVGAGPTTGVTVISGEKALIAWNGSDFVKVASTAAAGGSNTQVQYNSSGVLAGSSNLTFDGTTLTANALTLTNKLTIANGGTNATATPTAGAVAYGTGTAYAFTAAGTSNQVLISNGASAPTWSNLSSIGVSTFSAGTTGFTPSSATSGAITLAGTLATTNGGTGLTSFTANGVVYASSTSALATGSALTFDGTNLGIGTSAGAAKLQAVAADDARVFQIGGATYALRASSSTSVGGMLLQGVDNTGSLSYQPLAIGGSYVSFLYSGTSEGMRLTSTGLGIGTSSPSQKLDVNGTAKASKFYVKNTVTTVGATASAAVLLDQPGGSNQISQISFGYANDAATTYTPAYVGYITTSTAGYTNGALIFGTRSATTDSAPSEVMRLDSVGNLGLGVTPSAWDSGYKAFQTSNTGVFSGASGAIVAANLYVQSGFAKYLGNGYAPSYSPNTSDGNHYWYTTANNSSGAGATATLTTSMLLNSSGNLGLGVTPSAWGSDYKAFQITGGRTGALWTSVSKRLVLSNNMYVNSSGTDTYVASDYASRYDQIDGTHSWRTAPSGTAGNAISFTQAMTLDASGNLALGSTTSNISGGASGSQVITLSASASGRNALFELKGTRTAADQVSSYIRSFSNSGATPGVDLQFWRGATDTDGYLTISTSGSERARITSGGYFKASDTGTYDGSTGAYHEFYQSANNSALFIRAVNAGLNSGSVLGVAIDRNTTDNTFYAISYYNNGAGAYKFRVADSGNVTNTNGSYGTISDAKMKTDIVDAGSQWADIKAVRFRKFKMKNDPTGLVQLGVVAQELEQNSPGLVEEHIDRDADGNDLGTTTKSVKTSVLLMKAAVALQEAMERIEKLESRVAQLEGK